MKRRQDAFWCKGKLTNGAWGHFVKATEAMPERHGSLCWRTCKIHGIRLREKCRKTRC